MLRRLACLCVRMDDVVGAVGQSVALSAWQRPLSTNTAATSAVGSPMCASILDLL